MSLEDKRKEAETDLLSLNRVSHRLFLVDTQDRLQQVLDKLLPRLLQRIGDNHQAQSTCPSDEILKSTLSKIHSKLVEMLSHTMKRVRDARCPLPCANILDLLLDKTNQELEARPKVDPFTLNLSLAFLNLGIKQCTADQLEELLPGLIVLHASFLPMVDKLQSPSVKSQWHQVTHLLYRTMERLMQVEDDHLRGSSSTATSSATTGSASTTAASATKRFKPDENVIVPTKGGLNSTRSLLSKNDSMAGALYELVMDILLYQPARGGAPPPGLSQAGHDRLREGTSDQSRDWAAEMAQRSVLRLAKMRMLDWIAPSRRWGIFLGMDSASQPSEIGLTRTVVLLIAATGDPDQEVASRAGTYLKQHCDSQREPIQLYGDVFLLLSELLGFCVGATNAQLALGNQVRQTIGVTPVGSNEQLLLSFKRRMVSPTTFAAMADYVTKVLTDLPQLGSDAESSKRLLPGATLAVLACNKMLSRLRTSEGLSLLQGKPYVSAAQLLNTLVTQLSKVTSPELVERTTSLMSRSLEIACASLASFASTSGTTTNSTTSEGNASVRDSLYGAICVLARINLPFESISWLFAAGKTGTAGENSSGSIATASLLFQCLLREGENLRPRVVAALDALLAAYCRLLVFEPPVQQNEPVVTNNENPWENMFSQPVVPQDPVESSDDASRRSDMAKLVIPLLWTSSRPNQPKQARVAAARWSSDLLYHIDCTNACHLLCFIAGDSDVTAANVAKDGLGLKLDGIKLESVPQRSLADFSELCDILFADEQNSVAVTIWRPTYWDFPPNGKAAALQYLLKSLLHDMYGGEEAMAPFVGSLTRTIVEAAGMGREHFELLDVASGGLACCLDSSQIARTLLASIDSMIGIDGLANLALELSSSKSRRLIAECWGHVLADADIWERMNGPIQLESSLRSCMTTFEDTSSVGSRHGAAYLAATCTKVFRQHYYMSELSGSCGELVSSVLIRMSSEINSVDDTVGNAYTDGVAIAFSYDGDDCPLLGDVLVAGATQVLTQLSLGLQKFGVSDSFDVARVCRIAKASGICLAATTVVAGSDRTPLKVDPNLMTARLKCVDCLFQLLGSNAFRKDEEVALCTGEALAMYCDAFSPSDVQWSSESRDWPTTLDEEFARSLPPHQQVVYTLLRKAKLENNPQKRTAVAPALFGVVALSARRINTDSRNSARFLAQELAKHISEVQSTFISLLSDPKSKHLCRESCCLGLAACKSIVDASTQGSITTSLLRAFGQTTNHGGSAMQETPEQAAIRRNEESGNRNASEGNDMDHLPEVGGAAGIAEASLGAYREMASAAVALGRPDVLYALLMLSVSNPVWTTDGRDYGPSALLGAHSLLGSHTNTLELRHALQGHMGKLIPRVLRGCYTPNKETREQMQSLWDSLTGGGAEARATITEYLLPTVDSLLVDATTSKSWRTRTGACGAIAKIIVGRSWRELGGGGAVLFDDEVNNRTSSETTGAGIRLLRLWRAVSRSLDDVRVNVREAGESLGRAVRGLTLRLVDPNSLEEGDRNEDTDKDSIAAAGTALRWLIRHGLDQQCPEAAGVCISCLVGIVDVASPLILQPLIPDLIRSLLLAMSNLEPAAFSYLQVRAAGQDSGSNSSYDELERLRLQLVQSGPLATAVTKCIDMIPKMDIQSQKMIVPELDSAIRQSSGLATRTAAADCVVTLCSTCPNAFRNSGASHSNPSVSLLRALYSASERERGQAARDKYAHAFGSLAALCPGPSVRSLALRATEKYKFATGSNDDPAVRKVAAGSLRSIAVKASNQFSDGGNADIWCRRVLPLSYLGMRDSDSKVASLFADVWQEGGSAAMLSGTADGFGILLEERLILYLCKECERGVKDVAWSRRVISANALKELADREILAPAPRSTGSTPQVQSPEVFMRMERRVQGSQLALTALVSCIAETRLWTGKKDVVDACSVLISKWVSCSPETDSAVPPPSPITFNSSTADDLFVNDSWFKRHRDEELPEETTQKTAPEKTNTDSEVETEEISSDDNMNIDQEAESSNERELPPNTSAPTILGLCRLFLVQAFPSKRSVQSVTTEEVLPYRAEVLKGLTRVLEALDHAPLGPRQKEKVYEYVTQVLTPVFDKNTMSDSPDESPLIISRTIDCFASCFWDGIGYTAGETNSKYWNVLQLSRLLQSCCEPTNPWTVKCSALNGCARLASKCSLSSFRDHALLSVLVDCGKGSLRDRKFWRVRLAGMEILQALIARVGASRGGQPTTTEERQLTLEALLPQKESLAKVAKDALKDSEARVTACATEILREIALWP
eukprot:Nitzschia sp. Nitz4//scaffold36_size144017//17459//24583//NITZ4_003068-RA/size144017-snap-gene-0.188-mRNA-1//1//CDS//3329549402//6334//frame0